MKVLVTGANGFVGRALCLHLVDLGHEVVPVVRRQSNVVDEVIVHNTASLKAALRGCDCVIHLAARAHIMKENELNPLQAFRISNVETTIELAKHAIEEGVQRFVLMSTIKVNGEETATGSCFRPDDSANPKDPYAISKWEAEQALFEIAKSTGLEVVIIRPPLVYGPGVKGNFATLIKWVKNGVPLPFGAIGNRRSMIGLDNLLSFTALCADFNRSKNTNGQVFLISDGEDVSTTELLHRVAKSYGCKSRLFSLPEELIRLGARCIGQTLLADRLLGSLLVDDSKARQLLGWHPPSSMCEQLQKMALHDASV